MSLRSKGFTKIENKYKYSGEYEIVSLALASLVQTLSVCELPNEMHNVIMLLGAKVGIDSHGTLNDKEKNLIDFIMGDIFADNIDDIYDKLSRPVSDIDFFLVDRISQLGVDIAIHFLNYILCFAYIDGVIDDDTAECLDNIFNVVFIEDLFN